MTLAGVTLPRTIESDPAIAWTADALRYADVDANGHVGNKTFAALAESGRVLLLETAMGAARPSGSLWVVARLLIEFKAELFFPGSARTGTWIARIGNTSLTIHQAIFGEHGLAATADAVCVLLDAESRRPLGLPAAMRTAAARFVPAELARPSQAHGTTAGGGQGEDAR